MNAGYTTTTEYRINNSDSSIWVRKNYRFDLIKGAAQ